MARKFDVAVIGKGMMGAAAARHLAKSGVAVALVGPDEPAERRTHAGIFASHYDAGRITRTIDEDPDWALMARRSIERYAAIEAESGLRFYGEAGCLIVAPDRRNADDYIMRALNARDKVGVEAAFLEADRLKTAFPALCFPEGYVGLHEPHQAGYIDPRTLVRAQTRLAASHGAAIVSTPVTDLRDRQTHVELQTADGNRILADRAIVAAGGYSIRPSLLPRPVALDIKARTVLLAEVDEAGRERFARMPSVIQEADDQARCFYALPPIRYPDGRDYLKIGGDPVDIDLHSEAEINAWFRGEGSETAARHMRDNLRQFVPELKAASLKTLPCIVSFTRHGYPYIGFAGSERIVMLTGGNGKAAKSSDEIGRLGAVLATTGTLENQGYLTDFRPIYR